MKLSEVFLNLIDNVNAWIGRCISWVVLLLMLLTVLEVILRRVFNAPTIWSFEVCTQLFALNFMIAAAFTLLHDGHVSVDIFRARLSEKNKAVLDIVCYLLFFFPFTTVMLWKGYEYAQMSWATRETSWSVFAPPLYPIKAVIPLTFLLLILQGSAVVIRRLQTLRQPKGAAHD